ncbi:hypothetical protein LXL04_020419 [Taraxacum kok-saghyz]
MVGKRGPYFGIYPTGQQTSLDIIWMSCILRRMSSTIFFYTIMDVKTKTKDNASAIKDLKLYCRKRKGFGKNERPIYALEKRQKKAVCEWVEKLRFPDGYVSNLGRCVDLNACRLFGMKSHHFHVFMQRLMPIAFREMLPKNVWEAIIELSLFFKTLTATSITIEDMERLD